MTHTKSIRYTILGVLATLFLTLGLTKAAAAVDPLTDSDAVVSPTDADLTPETRDEYFRASANIASNCYYSKETA
ncbi:MAG: hypothetical protein ACFE0O_07540 [Opitutales bacterium]